MTSNYKRPHRMRSQRQTKRSNIQSKKKASYDVAVSKNLPLSSKMVYIDMKRGKDADLVEEHLIKLGARVEAFLSADINYVISSCGPTKVEDVQKCSDENPKSPMNSVASPFSCIPSPSAPAPTEAKKPAVSRGKALAHLARSKHKTSTVVTNAEKMGVKVVSVEVANKWMERELKKLEKEVKIEALQDDSKLTKKKPKTKSKTLKGYFIKFEASNCHYRPIKSVLEKWPKVNSLAPPGLHPFVESKIKFKHFGNQRFHGFKHAEKNNKARKSIATEAKEKSLNLGGQSKQVQQGLLATPITTAGDVKRNHCYKKNANINKQQGYCDCCEMKFKSFEKHIKGEEHQNFAKDKGNYESLDNLISESPSTINFLQAVLLTHCMQIQKEIITKIPETSAGDTKAKPMSSQEKNPGSIGAASRSSGIYDANAVVPLNLHAPVFCPAEISPSRDQLLLLTESNFTSQTDNLSQPKSGTPKAVAEESIQSIEDQRPQAIVIRRPVPSGIFTSPRRPRQPTPNKTPRGMERSMVFRDSPIGSLQPSPCSGSPTVSVGSVQVTTPVTNSAVGASCIRKKTSSSNAFLVRAIDFAKANSPNCEQTENRGQDMIDVNAQMSRKTSEAIEQDSVNPQSESKRRISEKAVVVRRLSMEYTASNKSPSDLKTAIKYECSGLRTPNFENERKQTKNLKATSNLLSPVTGVCDEKSSLSKISVKEAKCADSKEDYVEGSMIQIEDVTKVHKRNSFGSYPQLVEGSDMDPSQQNLSVTPTKIRDDGIMEVKLRDKSERSKLTTLSGLETNKPKNDLNDVSSLELSRKGKSKPEQVSECASISLDPFNALRRREPYSVAKSSKNLTQDTKMELKKSADETHKVRGKKDKIFGNEKLKSDINLHKPQTAYVRLEKDDNVDKLSRSQCKKQKAKHSKLQLQKCHKAVVCLDDPKNVEEKPLGFEDEDKNKDVITTNFETKGDEHLSTCQSLDPIEKTDLENKDESMDKVHVSQKKKSSRFCSQFTYKGLYANNGLGLEEEDSGLASIAVPNIAERVKSRRSFSVFGNSTECVDNDFKPENRFREVKKPNMVTKQSTQKKGSKKTKKVALKKVRRGNKNQENTKCEKNESFGESDIVVPNIADCVKRRRSCTQFNHEGLYANNGECSDDDRSKSFGHFKQVEENPNRSFQNGTNFEKLEEINENSVVSTDANLTEKSESKHMIIEKNLNEELDQSADHSKKSNCKEQIPIVFSNSSASTNQRKKESRSPAVVIRRKKSLSNLHYSHKQRPDVDWGISPENYEVFKENANDDWQPKFQTDNQTSTCNSPVTHTSHHKVPSGRLQQIEHHGPVVPGSPRFNSPRFKLKITRLPSNEGYSSTIEEYYDNHEYQNSPSQIKSSRKPSYSTHPKKLQTATPTKDNIEVISTDSLNLLTSSPESSNKGCSEKPSLIKHAIKKVENAQDFGIKDFVSVTERKDFEKNCFLQTAKVHPKPSDATDISYMGTVESFSNKPEAISLKHAGLEASCIDSKKTHRSKGKSGKRKRESSLPSTSPLKANKKTKTAGKWNAKSVVNTENVKNFNDSTEPYHGLVKDSQISTKILNASDFGQDEFVGNTWLKGIDEGTSHTLRNSSNETGNVNQGSDENAAEDYLAFVPNFSSPGKATDSSWGDVCESYLSSSVRKPSNHQSPLRHLKSPLCKSGQRSVSPKKFFLGRTPNLQLAHSPNQQKICNTTPIKRVNISPSPTKFVAVSPSRGNMRDKSQIGSSYRTPPKRSSNQDSHQSPVIKVDRVISFNMMSPQKLRSNLFQSK